MESTKQSADSYPQAYGIAEFAASHGLSKAHVYNLIREGLGPRLMRAGRRTLVSAEAAADWRRRMEAASSLKAA